MKFEFDPRKDAANRRKHGLSLALSKELDWRNEMAWVDARFAYDECRMLALVPYGDVLYALRMSTEASQTNYQFMEGSPPRGE